MVPFARPEARQERDPAPRLQHARVVRRRLGIRRTRPGSALGRISPVTTWISPWLRATSNNGRGVTGLGHAPQPRSLIQSPTAGRS